MNTIIMKPVMAKLSNCEAELEEVSEQELEQQNQKTTSDPNS